MLNTDARTIWVSSCVLWAWVWGLGALVWAPFTFGISLLALIPAGLSFWAVWLPVGKQPVFPSAPPSPTYPQIQPPQSWPNYPTPR